MRQNLAQNILNFASRIYFIVFVLTIFVNAETIEYSVGSSALVVYHKIPNIGENETVPKIDAGLTDTQDIENIRIVSNKYTIRVRSAATSYEWVDVFAHYTYNRGAEVQNLNLVETGEPHPTNTQHYPNFTKGWSHTYGNIEMSPNHPVEVEIAPRIINNVAFTIKNQAFFKAAVHPSHKASVPIVKDGKVYFTISNPAQVTIDINGQMDDHNALTNPIGHPTHTVSLFANPILSKAFLTDPNNRVKVITNGVMPLESERNDYDILSFAPGIHDIGLSNKIYPGKTYYIPGDAIVFGTFNNLNVDKQSFPSAGSGIKFSGYGTISGARGRHSAYVPGGAIGKDGTIGYNQGIYIDQGRDYEIYGICLTDPSNFALFTPSGLRGAVRWAKAVTWRANGDGLAGNDNVDDCFMRTSDDSSYVRGNRKRCTFWKDHHSAVFFMAFIPDSPLLIEDCDIIYLRSRDDDGRGGGLFNARGEVERSQTSGALPTDVTFRNIRIHDKQSNMPIFNMLSYRGNDDSGNTTTSVGLSYSNIKFENITIASTSAQMANGMRRSVKQYLLGCAQSPWNEGALTFKNVNFEGVLLNENNFKDYFVTNQHILTQTFDTSDIPVIGVFVNGSIVKPLISQRNTRLVATVLPENATNKVVSWISSNPAVASVDNTGLVTGHSTGTVTITATSQDGEKSGVFHLSVNGMPISEPMVFSSPGTYTWEVPENVSDVTVECRGGGGSGGSVRSEVGSSLNIRGGGGAGGNYAKTSIIPVSMGQTYTVTVGAGGAPSMTGFTHNQSLSSQTGGSSSFRTADLTTTHVLATGGLGGKNGLRIGAATGAASNPSGTVATTSGSIGDIIIAGGNGSGAASTGSGGGGGGAGSISAGASGAAPAAGAGGNLGGGGGGAGVTDLANPSGNGISGMAPGGGGSGAARNTDHAIFVNGPGGTGGAGSVVITYSNVTGTAKFSVTAGEQSITAGQSFDVTIIALSQSNAIVTGDTNVITMTSPDLGSLMEFDWNGDGTFGDDTGTLDNGAKTIKARNKKAETVSIVATADFIGTLTPLTVSTSAGAFSKLQLLVPGETALAGTNTGKTGSPIITPVGISFSVTVNAVDDFWNRINTVTDSVAITTTDSFAALPANTPLLAGTILLPVTFNTPGAHTLTASDVTSPTQGMNISPIITVTVVARTWGATFDNRWNTTTANWAGLTFANQNAVSFSSNSVNSSVDLNGGTVSPSSMVVDATSAVYEISNGSISGLAAGLTKAQSGTLILNTQNTYNGPTIVNGGLLRLKNINALPSTSALSLNSGILGLEAGNFTRSLGAASGQLLITAANTGFAAFGANRSVNLGGAGAQVTWGSGGFFSSGSSLILGHASATHTIDFQNPINIAGVNREISVPDGFAAVDAIVSGAITNSANNTHMQKNGNGALMLSGTNAWGGELRILAGSVMLGGNTGNVIADTANIQLGAGGTSSNLVFDLNGCSEAIATLNLGGQNTTTAPGSHGNQHSIINSGVQAVLTINGLNYFAAADPLAFQNGQALISANIHTGTGNKNFSIHKSLFNAGSGPLAEEVLISGSLTGTSITKLLSGTLVLTNPQYTGNTTITAGTLTVRKSGTQTNANPNNDSSTISIASGAVLHLDYTGSDRIARLIVGSNPAITSGSYGSAELPTFISGSGKLIVGADSFLVWAGNNQSILFDGDDNNDGIRNGVAWVLGATSPTVKVNHPTPQATQTGRLKIKFSMLPASARNGAQLFLEHSSDLGIADPWSTITPVPDVTSSSSSVSFIVNDSDVNNPSNNLDVEASISESEARAGKLFGRLRVER